MRWNMLPTMILVFTGLSGCASVGPVTVARDRFDYISAISESWKSQMLLISSSSGTGCAGLS
jgi:hypothetical protein